jgi:hypothetical protein
MGIEITGIDTPFGGISWKHTESAKNGVQELFYFLETKRILINPSVMEKKEWCEQSAIEIKKKLAELLTKYDFNSDTIKCIRLMINSCNYFLDEIGNINIQGIIYKNGKGDWEDMGFSKSMKKLRKDFRENIETLSEAYKIAFIKNIPEEF